MKKNIPVFILTLIFLSLTNRLSLANRQQTENPPLRAGLIPVAVRVFDGKQPVTSLRLQDFEVLENGIPRPVEALYLVDKNAIERREAAQDFQPDVTRKFYFLFQLFEYHPKLAEAIRYLFDQELLPGDSLEIQTPSRDPRLKPWHLSNFKLRLT